jgi:hypothetical protein
MSGSNLALVLLVVGGGSAHLAIALWSLRTGSAGPPKFRVYRARDAGRFWTLVGLRLAAALLFVGVGFAVWWRPR